jgi:hypothetical protein
MGYPLEALVGIEMGGGILRHTTKQTTNTMYLKTAE